MGWQEDSENDETCAPLTEDEMREFQVISEQVGRPKSDGNSLPVASLNQNNRLKKNIFGGLRGCHTVFFRNLLYIQL